jgi:hypothetical protein
MAVYLVKLPASAQNSLFNGVDCMVVEAASAPAAITAAKVSTNTPYDTIWDSAVATLCTAGTIYLEARSVSAFA